MAKISDLSLPPWLAASRPLLALGLLLAMAWWLETALESASRGTAADSAKLPDFGLSGFTLRSFAQDGGLRYEARGAAMQHDPAAKESLASDVHVLALRAGHPPWIMDAREARFDDAGTRTSLLGGVTLQREAAPGFAAIRILTDSLHYLPQEDYAETADPITIYRDADYLKSVGVRAWLEHGKLHLLSRVRGRHAPRTEPTSDAPAP